MRSLIFSSITLKFCLNVVLNTVYFWVLVFLSYSFSLPICLSIYLSLYLYLAPSLIVSCSYSLSICPRQNIIMCVCIYIYIHIYIYVCVYECKYLLLFSSHYLAIIYLLSIFYPSTCLLIYIPLHPSVIFHVNILLNSLVFFILFITRPYIRGF